MRFRHEFGHRQLFGLPTSQEAKRTDKHRSSDEHRGCPLGQRPLTYAQFASLLSRGAEIRTTLLTDTFWLERLPGAARRVRDPAVRPRSERQDARRHATVHAGAGHRLDAAVADRRGTVSQQVAGYGNRRLDFNEPTKTVVTLSKVG